MKKQTKENSIVVTTVEEGSIDAVLIGRTPLILNRMSEKAKHELLMPKGRKTAAEKASNLKHDPIMEFRASAHTTQSGPTLLAIPAAAPKRALASAALDMPGAKKSQIGRLAWVAGEYLSVYGEPKLFMSITRSADMNRTPDVRTRLIVPNWAVRISVRFVTPILNPTVIINLLAAAGMYIGVGDWRNEKGAGSYGQFSVLSEAQAAEDKNVQYLFEQGRDVQLAAMEEPEAYDDETRELLTWFDAQLQVRGKKSAA